jgi:hypothetical protein
MLKLLHKLRTTKVRKPFKRTLVERFFVASDFGAPISIEAKDENEFETYNIIVGMTTNYST